MQVSIIVCTYNRASSLKSTLDALKAQVFDSADQCEVIVVDNNSTDSTRDTVIALMHEWKNLKYVFEGKQGLSNARNKGIDVALGEVILFTDDDVLPEPDWMATIVTRMAALKLDACGGYIAPIWEKRPPKWLTNRFHGFLAIRMEREDEYIIRTPSEAPFGANMAFRKEVFKKIGKFDTSRGRKGKILASGEDGELFERIFAAGLRVGFLGSAKVHHKVEAFRTNIRYFLKWRYQTSRNIVISKGIQGEKRIFNIPYFLFPQAARAFGRVICGFVTTSREEVVHRLIVLWHFFGTIDGLIQTRHKNTNLESGTG